MIDGLTTLRATNQFTRINMLTAIAPLGIGLLLLILLFWTECQAAVSVWYHSTAYGHCFLVLPIVAYLIWDRYDSIQGIAPEPTSNFVLLALPLSLAWLAAERLGIMEGRQIIFILLVELLLLTALGWELFRAMLGPLLYLVFLVPFGAFITPALQLFTATFIDFGLTILSIPHFANDMIVEVSAGTFYVAEACAGLRFLIASIAFGVFFALLNYHSPVRRLTFIIASILIPVVANGFRALGIVVLGNILGSAEAAAADHIIYGWIFFSIVMLLLVAAGLPFREQSAKSFFSGHGTYVVRTSWAPLLVVLLGSSGPAAARALDRLAEPVHFNKTPVFEALPGCTFIKADPALPLTDHYTTTMTCADRVWAITINLLSAKVSVPELNEVRRRLIGPLDQDEAVNGPLQNVPGWQLLVSQEPVQITAISSWINGEVSEGGLRQRFRQARNSIFGGDHDAYVIAITIRPTRASPNAESRIVTSDLSHFIALQPNFATMINDVTRR